jgi:hypothetical protein
MRLGTMPSRTKEGQVMPKPRKPRRNTKLVDPKIVDAVERSDKLITDLLAKLDLTPEERTAADILSIELLRQSVAQFTAARIEARKHKVHLRIRVAQAALAAALQGMMTYPADRDE